MKKILLFSILSIFVFSACKKEVTEVQQVNQAFSAIYTVLPGDWSTDNTGISYNVNLTVPELNKSIYLGGGVLVYISFAGTDYYEALPEVFDGITYGAIHSRGAIGLDISALSGVAINPPNQNISVKVILINAQALGLHKDVNLNDLKAVQKAFNIQ